jgi:hypothetical protein
MFKNKQEKLREKIIADTKPLLKEIINNAKWLLGTQQGTEYKKKYLKLRDSWIQGMINYTDRDKEALFLVREKMLAQLHILGLLLNDLEQDKK